MSHLQVALDMAAAGWPVFPCSPTSKRPALPRCKRCDRHPPSSPPYLACAADGHDGHGLYDATLDPARIALWWRSRPRNLIGTPTAGLLVVDLDVDEHVDGRRWWEAQLDEHGDPPPGPVVTTPSGGRHLYYRAPVGLDVRNSASKLAPGVDIRATGGYVVAPGSVLPDGREYELADADAQLHDAPEWLTDAIADASRPVPNPAPTPQGPRPSTTDRASRYARTALESELGRLATAGQGGRNQQLNDSAFSLGQLVGAGHLDATTATYDLLSVALRIGLTEHEATATIASGLRAGIATPRSVPA